MGNADTRAEDQSSSSLLVPRWTSESSNEVLEIAVDPQNDNGPGACNVPCVIFVWVAKLDASTTSGRINFEIAVTTSTEKYRLLLDGDVPVSFVAQPSKPEYFLFDSRQASPLLTVVLTVPYDTVDPLCELIALYVLDCAADEGQDQASLLRGLRDVAARPSLQKHTFIGRPNAHGQVTAFDDSGKRHIRNGGHCYYRIGVVSHRLVPVPLSIRAFDWHAGAALSFRDPLHGRTDGGHYFTYQVETSEEAEGKEPLPDRQISLSLEVCYGTVKMRTAASADSISSKLGGHQLVLPGGTKPVVVPLRDSRWLQVSTQDRKPGGYVVTVEDPSTREWLAPYPSPEITFHQEEGDAGVTLEWSPAHLFGTGHPPEGSGGDEAPVAEYEVFVMLGRDTTANYSTPCGLYEEAQRTKLTRFAMKTERIVTMPDVQYNNVYIFNVVARSLSTGHSVAYKPLHKIFLKPSSFQYWSAPRSTFWDQTLPIIIIVLMMMITAYMRLCCKGPALLPGIMEMSARHAPVRIPPADFSGSYAPPSVVGVSSQGPTHGPVTHHF